MNSKERELLLIVATITDGHLQGIIDSSRQSVKNTKRAALALGHSAPDTSDLEKSLLAAQKTKDRLAQLRDEIAEANNQ